MLHEFLLSHRDVLIESCRQKAAQRHPPQSADTPMRFGIPLFLDQLTETLRHGPDAAASGGVELTQAATRHGRELLSHGFTVDQVVHDYGDLCQSITGLAIDEGVSIRTEEFRTLNRCLDEGIAKAVTEFTRARELAANDGQVQELNERLGMLAHELRNHLNTAMLAVSAMRTGNVGMSGATGGALDRSLLRLRGLIDRSLADVRVTAGMPVRHGPVQIAALAHDLAISASLDAKVHGCEFSVEVQEGAPMVVEADADMLLSAVGNLLQNAFKFTQPNSKVVLRAFSQGDRVLIEVQDQCGGLPAGAAKTLFAPFAQAGADRTGMGLGLSISRRSVQANGGTLTVRDLPGSGCVFTIELPAIASEKPKGSE